MKANNLISKVICEENYYFDCSVFCVSKNDSQMGHYTCDPVTGGKVCMEGWAGDDCLTRKLGNILFVPVSNISLFLVINQYLFRWDGRGRNEWFPS